VNLRRFNKAKRQGPAPRFGNSQYRYRLRDERIVSSLKEKDLEVLVDEKLDMS